MDKNAEKVCKSKAQVLSLMKKMAKLGFISCSVIVEAGKLRSTETYLASLGYRVYAFINGDNNGQVDVEWDLL